MEDCNAALSIRPAYSKARLRRADCNAKVLTGFGGLLVATPSDIVQSTILVKYQLSATYVNEPSVLLFYIFL